jgi:hypothetical protein
MMMMKITMMMTTMMINADDEDDDHFRACRLEALDVADLQHLVGRDTTPGDLLYSFSAAGIHLLPTDHDAQR